MSKSSNPPYLIGTGFAQGLSQLTGLEFDPSKPYTFCKLCGSVFQSSSDRALTLTPATPPVGPLESNVPHDTGLAAFEVWSAESQRRRWSKAHARTHTDREHRLLALSGRFCTPEAAQKLVPYGIIDVMDAVISEVNPLLDGYGEHMQALAQSKPIPTDDATSA